MTERDPRSITRVALRTTFAAGDEGRLKAPLSGAWRGRQPHKARPKSRSAFALRDLDCVPSMNRNQEVEVLWGAWSQDPRANRKAQAARPRLKEAKSDSCGSTNRNRVEGAASQGERAIDREALATKGGRRRRGDRAAKATESYLGRSRLVPERATPMRRSEKSAEAVVAVRGAEQGERPTLGSL